MADLQKTVSIIFQGEDKASGVAGSLAKNLEGVGTGAGAAAAKVDELDRELEGIEKKAPGIGGVGDALKTLAASLVVKDFIDANLAFEKFVQSMTATTGSAKEARTEFEYVREVSNRLGIETRSTAEAYAKFAASVKGTALEGEGARTIFEGFAGTMSRVGSSSADINGAFVQLAQGISKGKFELEDLKSIAERVPGFFNAFAESLGVTTPALFNLISAGKIGSVEIAKFADTLKTNLDGASFEGYAQSFSRLRNSIDNTYLILGEAGAWDVLTKGLQAGTTAIAGTLAVVGLLGDFISALYSKLSLGSNFDFGDAIAKAMDRGADRTRSAVDALFGAENAAKAVGNAGAEAGTKIAEGMGKGALSGDALKKALGDVDKSLKALGIDPKTFVDPVKELEGAFKDLASSSAASGDQIVTGLIGALQKLPQDASLDTFRQQVAYAFRDGRITAEEYAQALALIDTKQKNLSPSFGPVSDAARKQAEELNKAAAATKKAADEASKYALEMEKLASNERIKNIEAKVSLNIAQLENDTKRIEATFASIDNTVNSTGELLGDLFGLFGDYDNLSFGAIRAIEDQISAENKRRQDALDLQKKLTEAQINQIRAQTKAVERGDSIIKVDGAGLQPHLEAFMWEILRTIQVRVNADGLKLLLGT